MGENEKKEQHPSHFQIFCAKYKYSTCPPARLSWSVSYHHRDSTLPNTLLYCTLKPSRKMVTVPLIQSYNVVGKLLDYTCVCGVRAPHYWYIIPLYSFRCWGKEKKQAEWNQTGHSPSLIIIIIIIFYLSWLITPQPVSPPLQ